MKVERLFGTGDIVGMENLIDHGSVESGRYHLARRTLYEMLHDRGYAVATSDINMNLADFRANFGDKPDPTSLQFSASLLSDTSKQVFRSSSSLISLSLAIILLPVAIRVS